MRKVPLTGAVIVQFSLYVPGMENFWKMLPSLMPQHSEKAQWHGDQSPRKWKAKKKGHGKQERAGFVPAPSRLVHNNCLRQMKSYCDRLAKKRQAESPPQAEDRSTHCRLCMVQGEICPGDLAASGILYLY